MEELDFRCMLESFSMSSLLIRDNLKKPNSYTDAVNASGDKASWMDLISNDIIVDQLHLDPWCAGVASEELDGPQLFNNNGKYVVVVDPLDGSSNLEVDNSVGTIFGVFEVKSKKACLEDFLQPAQDLVAAGYILYGAKNVMVVAHKGEVAEFEVAPDLAISTCTIICPEEGKIVAVNSGNYPRWDQLTKNWFDTVVEYGKSSFRYSGCMVADFHRILLQGGMFAYPSDKRNLNGKLRLLFECGPLAYIVHMAGGTSTNGDALTKTILNINPGSLHQTTPVFLGSKQNIEDYFRG
jgi:fructose-1,6-bisphosphatase I